MTEASQSEIDRQTIAAFERVWQETVIAGTSDSVKASVKAAITELVETTLSTKELNKKYLEDIERHTAELSSLGKQVIDVIDQGKATTDQVRRVANLGPELADKLSGLQEQISTVATLLKSDQAWRDRLARWRQDRGLREARDIIAWFSRNPIAPGEDGSDVAPPIAHGEDRINETPTGLRNTRSLRHCLAIAIVIAIFAIAGWRLGLISPSKWFAPAENAGNPPSDIPQLAVDAKLVDDQWNALRKDKARNAELKDYCSESAPCAVDPVSNVAIGGSFSAVWAAQSAESQWKLFKAVTKATQSIPFPENQCKTLLTRGGLAKSAPEFLPTIAGCVVQQYPGENVKPANSKWLHLIAERLLEYKQTALLAANDVGGAGPLVDNSSVAIESTSSNATTVQ